MSNDNKTPIETHVALYVINELYSFLRCKNCNGVGVLVGDTLGVYECYACGGDGHTIHDYQSIGLHGLIKELKNDILSNAYWVKKESDENS